MDSYSQKKQKITLEDYDYKQDLESRLLMSQFSTQDLEVLEEILYSPLRISIKKMEKNLGLDSDELLPILMKLSQTGLFTFEEEYIVADKEKRKYFEGQVVKFEEDFKPGMEFLQSLLKKVPIHVLPGWYSLPRLSEKIFESIVEKYLLTPQIFQRYLADLTFTDPNLSAIVKDIYESPNLKVYASELMEKYNLSKEEFETALLQLEFHLIGYLSYEKIGDSYQEVVTPFHEWCEYCKFLRETTTAPLPSSTKVTRLRDNDFAYVEDLSFLITLTRKEPLNLESAAKHPEISKHFSSVSSDKFDAYLDRLITTLCQLKLADLSEHRLLALESSADFLDLPPSDQALFLYRHPFNRSAFKKIPADLITDRNLREAEKSIIRVLNAGWVYFDEFIKGVMIPLSETSSLTLKKQGRQWKYTIPSYNESELALIKATVLDWLFQVGMTAVGTVDGKECFKVTDFGKSLYGQE